MNNWLGYRNQLKSILTPSPRQDPLGPAKFGVALSLVATIILLVFTYINLRGGNTIGGYLELLTAALFFLNALLFLIFPSKLHVRFLFVINLNLLACVLIYNGGFNSAGILWVGNLPLVTFLILRYHYSLYVIFIELLLIGFYVLGHFFGFFPSVYGPIFLIQFYLGYLVYSGIVIYLSGHFYLEEQFRFHQTKNLNELNNKLLNEAINREQVEEQLEENLQKMTKRNEEYSDIQQALLNVFEDLETEKQRAETEVINTRKFHAAVESSSDQIVITDIDGKIIYANPAASKITGYSPEEIIGNKPSLWGKQMSKEFYQNMWYTIKNLKKPFDGEVNNKRKNGELYTAAIHITPLLDANNQIRFFVSTERDITKLKLIDRMKTEFISLASHQLRTPLSGIKWYLELLYDPTIGQLNPQQKEFLDAITTSNTRMIELVNGLLNVSRIESGRLIVNPQPTNVVKLIEDLIKSLEPEIKEHQHDLTLDLDPTIPEINLDQALINEAFKNLTVNAIKYTPDHGHIKVSLTKDEANIIFTVTDNGYGIPVTEQPKIFSKFFRAANIARLETKGTGLGLYLVKLITEASGGTIRFVSEENKGTTFTITLPLGGSHAKTGEVGLISG